MYCNPKIPSSIYTSIKRANLIGYIKFVSFDIRSTVQIVRFVLSYSTHPIFTVLLSYQIINTRKLPSYLLLASRHDADAVLHCAYPEELLARTGGARRSNGTDGTGVNQ